MLIYAAEQRRQRRAQAALIEAIGIGYGGAQSRANARETARVVAQLRRD